MAPKLPDRLKGAKTLPDGKIMLKDGTIMSRSAWMSQKYTSTPIVKITSSPSASKPRVSAREAERQARRARADIKKGNKTDPFSNTAKMKKESPARTTARMAAAERAKAVPPSQRTAAETRAIKSESRVRIEREWRQMTADAKRQQSELRKMLADVKRSAKAMKDAAKGPKPKEPSKRGQSKKGGRSTRGGMRGGGGGGFLGGGGGLPDYNR